MRGFDNAETFSEGEDQWQNWACKIKTAVSGMNGEFAELSDAAEADGVGNLEGILKEDASVDASKETCVEASGELYSVLARCTSSETSTIARSVTGVEGVEAWSRVRANHSRRTLANDIRSVT